MISKSINIIGCGGTTHMPGDTPFYQTAGNTLGAGLEAWTHALTVKYLQKGRLNVKHLISHVVKTLEYFCEGKCAVIYTTLKMQQESGVPDGELEGLASIPRQIEGVLLGITMKEKEEGVFKVSVRSNEDINAAEFCARFGGGGHNAAAGCTVEGTLEEAKAKLIEAAEEIL